MKLRLILVMAALLTSGNGCVFFQIRDELRHVNQQMTQINTSLQQVNQRLGVSGESEESVNKSMQSIQISLRRIDDELASLLQMMEKAAKLVPGVNLQPSKPPPTEQEPTTATTPQPPSK